MTELLPVARMIEYELTERQWNECERVSLAILNKRKAGWKTDWHRGTFNKPHLSTRIGLCGEIAFHQIMRTYFKTIPFPDMAVQRSPNKVDFVWKTPLGSLHEVKTTVQSPQGGVNYLRQDVVERADLYWFMATTDQDSRSFYLRGFATRDHIKTKAVLKSGRGKWDNYVLDTDDLFPVSRFLNLKSRANYDPVRDIDTVLGTDP